jgi:hypothetical protein
MSQGQALAKAIRQRGLISSLSGAGFVLAMVTFRVFSLYNVPVAANIAISMMLALGGLAFGAVIALVQERRDNAQLRIAINNMTQSTAAMRTAAEAMLAISNNTLQRAEGAVQGSNEASANIETAAVAADKLSHSITRISHQLVQTNKIVRNAAGVATLTNDNIAALASVARRIGDVVKLIQDIAERTRRERKRAIQLLALQIRQRQSRRGVAQISPPAREFAPAGVI